MRNSRNLRAQNSNRNYGRCDICEVVYATETDAIQHMLSSSHHEHYESIQRRLGKSVSHFCPICGIGGIRDMNAWNKHVFSDLHSSNSDQYMHITNYWKSGLKQHQSNSSNRSKFSGVNAEEITESSVTSEAPRLGYTSRSVNTNSSASIEKAKTFKPHTSIQKALIVDTSILAPGDRAPNPSTYDHYFHQGSSSPKYGGPTDSRFQYPTESHLSKNEHGTICQGRSLRQRASYCTYYRQSYNHIQQDSRSRYSRRHSPKNILPYRSCMPQSRVCGESRRSSTLSVSGKRAARMASNTSVRRKNVIMAKKHNYGLRSMHSTPLSEHSAYQGSLKHGASVREAHSVEDLDSEVVGSSSAPTLPPLSPSSTIRKTHEIWELSEQLDELRRQNSVIRDYIQQLMCIRNQNIREIRRLRCKRSVLLREMNQSDSQGETDSSDAFNDGVADGLGQTETKIEENQSPESAIGEGVTSRHLSKEITDNNSPIENAMTVIAQSSPGLSRRCAGNHSLKKAVQPPENIAIIPQDKWQLGKNGTVKPDEQMNGKIQPNEQDNPLGHPTSDDSAKRRRLLRKPRESEAVTESLQLDNDQQATAGSTDTPESRVDEDRLLWVRRLLNHPHSRQYTFAELDKLAGDIIHSAASLKSRK